MFSKFKLKNGISSTTYILLGLFLMLFPGTATAIVTRLIGVAALIFGITRFMNYSKGERDSLSLGIAIIITVAGVFLLFNPNFIASILPTILGIFIVVEGVGELRSALVMRDHGYSRWTPAFALSLLVIIVGVVIVINPFATMKICIMVFGGAMVASGVAGMLGKKN